MSFPKPPVSSTGRPIRGRPSSSTFSARRAPEARSSASSPWPPTPIPRPGPPPWAPWPDWPAKRTSPASWPCSRRPRTATTS
ncbi:MAG: hypothetical protein MZW92_61145 [Comamonadaceae bacterium]|nr:hypothetical protein [Comamonadaceae bacterium]